MRSLSRSLSRALAGAALVVTMSTSGLARASGDTSTAEHLFQQGLDAMKKNQFKEACDAFAGSNEADASPGTEINLALCNEKQNKLASAWGWYRTAAGLAEQRGQKDRAELARNEATKLEPKLHKLVISVKAPSDALTVTRDGAPVPHATLGTDVPIDPGDYVIEVTAKGKQPWKQTVHIPPTPGVERLDVPALDDAPPDALTPPPGADTASPVTPAKDGSTQRTVAYITGGVGILALIAAGGIQIFNLAVTNQDFKTIDGKVNDANCNDPAKASKDCPSLIASRQSKDDARHSNQTASLVVGIGGVALLATGIVLLVAAPSGSGKSAELRKPLLVPIFGGAGGSNGLGVVGAF